MVGNYQIRKRYMSVSQQDESATAWQEGGSCCSKSAEHRGVMIACGWRTWELSQSCNKGYGASQRSRHTSVQKLG